MLLSVFIVFFHAQPRSTWCVTRCVQMQGAGVQAPTSASPANTLSVDECAWTGAIYMRGESCLAGLKNGQMLIDGLKAYILGLFSNLKAGPSC